MKVLSLLNEKGGVGKTTLATHIAAGLALRGKRVVLMDADPQGHATVVFGLKKEPLLHDLIVRDLPFQQALRRVPPENFAPPNTEVKGDLLVIPSNIETRSIPLEISDAMVVRNRLEELRGVIDFVIIDTAPTPSLLHANIYLATDAVIYPTKCEYLSFDGLLESLKHREQASAARERQGLNELRVGGIVPMMYRVGTQADEYGIDILRERFGKQVWPPIQLRTVWSQASFAKQLIFNYAPDTKAAHEAWQLVEFAEAI
ncbi:MAG: AAA family ATPase [Anaerolineae bacterium]